MRKNNLTKKIELIGEWSIPDSKDKVAGIFKYKDGQSSLEFSRYFDHDFSTDNNTKLKVVHGETIEGKITVTDVIFGNPMFPQGSAYLAIYGTHLDENCKIDNLSFDFDLLNEWAVSKHPYTAISFRPEDLKKIGNTHEKFTFQTGDFSCDLHISLGIRSEHLKGISTYHQSRFHIYSKPEKNIQDYIDIVIGIQEFLMLIMGRNLNLISMNHSLNKQECDVFLPVNQKENKGSIHDHFFNIKFLEKNYSKILTEWFEFYQKNKYLLKLFFDTMESRTIEDVDFYVYASMLEGYYKFKYEGETKYEERIKIVLSIFENDITNLEEFIQEISQMRHDIVHFNRRDKFDEDKLHRITHDLFFLMRIILLNSVGVEMTINTNQFMKEFLFLKRKK